MTGPTHVTVEDGRVSRRARRSATIIRASLVDTWAATAAGAYSAEREPLYTVEAFEDYLAH
jgi:hypothetical protein